MKFSTFVNLDDCLLIAIILLLRLSVHRVQMAAKYQLALGEVPDVGRAIRELKAFEKMARAGGNEGLATTSVAYRAIIHATKMGDTRRGVELIESIDFDFLIASERVFFESRKESWRAFFERTDD